MWTHLPSKTDESLPAFLTCPPKVLLVTGKGGVGKTTCALATALSLERSMDKKRILVMSTNPAHSLEKSIERISHSFRIAELDGARETRELRTRHQSEWTELLERVSTGSNEQIDRLFNMGWPILDELAAIRAIINNLHDTTIDHIIVDMAATGHSLKLLRTPALYRSWIKLLDSLLQKSRYLSTRFGKRTESPLESFLEECRDGVNLWDQIHLLGNEMQVCVVMIPTFSCFQETMSLVSELRSMEYSLQTLVVNNLLPSSVTKLSCTTCKTRYREQRDTLRRLHEANLACSTVLIEVSANEETCNVNAFWDQARSSISFPAVESLSVRRDFPPSTTAVDQYLPKAPILWIAGKGGVGKSTIASAIALRLAQKLGDRILLLSIDPAHSLADSLGIDIDRNPTTVTPFLDAIELDPLSVFKELKADVIPEIKEAFDKYSDRYDLPFDRAAFQLFLDTTPPTAEELTTIYRTMTLWNSGSYSRLVIDTAPSGHFMRLLEFPDMMLPWLREMLKMLINNNGEQRVPKFLALLGRVVRAVVHFKSTLRQNDLTEVIVVADGSHLSIIEACKLHHFCNAIQTECHTIILNRFATQQECRFCRAINHFSATPRATDLPFDTVVGIADQGSAETISGLLSILSHVTILKHGMDR